MDKPIIAIDCDDVIVGSVSSILEYSNITHGTDIGSSNYYSKDYALWKIKQNITTTRPRSSLAPIDYQKLSPFQDAIEVINQLAAVYELHIITARPDSLLEVTNKMIDNYFPDVFSSIIFTYKGLNETVSKADVCKEINAKYLIDDNLQHATIAADSGTSVLLFGGYPWNGAKNLPKLIKRVNDWYEIRDVLLK